jgi:hypothetical protein
MDVELCAGSNLRYCRMKGNTAPVNTDTKIIITSAEVMAIVSSGVVLNDSTARKKPTNPTELESATAIHISDLIMHTYKHER